MYTQRANVSRAAALALALLLPAPALAQRGLMDRLKRAVVEKTVEKTTEKATGASPARGDTAATRTTGGTATATPGGADGAREGRRRGATGGAVAAAAPDPGADLLEITDERVDRLVRGLRAERERWAALDRESAMRDTRLAALQRDYETKRAANDAEWSKYAARYAARERCRDSVKRTFQGKGVDPSVKKQREQEFEKSRDAQRADAERRLLPLRDRMLAARKRGDMAAVQAMNDTLMREMERVNAQAIASTSGLQQVAMQESAPERAADARCGPSPEEPQRLARPTELSARRDADPRHTVERAGIAASGLSQRQYAVLRERAQGYVRGALHPGSRWVFSPGELGVLQRRRAEIAGFGAELDRVSVPWTGRDWEAEAGE